MLRENFVKARLSRGEAVVGTWAVVPSPTAVDAIATSGLDFLIIDGEHGPTSFETAQQMVVAAEARGVSPLVRVSGTVEGEITKALDIGAHGVQVPNVSSAAGLEAAVRHAKYPPLGERGFSPFTRAGGYSGANAITLAATANANTLLAVHVEGQEAIHGVDALLGHPALDVVFIGLFDISKSLGRPGEVGHPEVLAAAELLAGKINAAGKIAGTIVTSDAQLSLFLAMGMRYITYSVDCDMLRQVYERAVAAFREATAATGHGGRGHGHP